MKKSLKFLMISMNGGSKISFMELKHKIPDMNPNFSLNEMPGLKENLRLNLKIIMNC